jgi:hypothetical protein
LKTRRALAAPNTTSGIFLSLNPFAIQESWRNIAGLVYMERNLLFQQEDIHSGKAQPSFDFNSDSGQPRQEDSGEKQIFEH